MGWKKNTVLYGVCVIISFLLLSPQPSFAACYNNAQDNLPNALVDGDIDHYDIECFYDIPDQWITAASNLDMFFADRSVGTNINSGLDCLTYATDELAPSHCKRTTHPDPLYAVDPSVVNWSRTGGYPRPNWDCGIFASSWPTMTTNFIVALENGSLSTTNCDSINPQNITLTFNNYDAFAFQFSYLNIDGNDVTIDDQPGGFVSQNPGTRDDIYDLTRTVEQRYPGKTYIYMTTSLARPLGNATGTNINNQIRNYTHTNNKVLLDVADIEAYDPQGNPCYDNRDGVQYCTANGNCENHPDDGQNYPAICPHYTTETEGGHLHSPGKIRIAQGIWIMMASMAGWTPGSTTVPSATPTPTRTPTPTLTPTSMLSPTVTHTPTPPSPTVTETPANPGDTDNDGDVDIFDYNTMLSFFGQTVSGGAMEGDVDTDGDVDIFDYNLMISNFGR